MPTTLRLRQETDAGVRVPIDSAVLRQLARSLAAASFSRCFCCFLLEEFLLQPAANLEKLTLVSSCFSTDVETPAVQNGCTKDHGIGGAVRPPRYSTLASVLFFGQGERTRERSRRLNLITNIFSFQAALEAGSIAGGAISERVQ